jgi:hypothetical protein
MSSPMHDAVNAAIDRIAIVLGRRVLIAPPGS